MDSKIRYKMGKAFLHLSRVYNLSLDGYQISFYKKARMGWRYFGIGKKK
tara:strand:- start:810 stop:956 length:147 start_codon:yes stop_codon:yes gene_type:complete